MSQEINIGDIGLSKTSIQSFSSNCAVEQFNEKSFSKNRRIADICISSVNCQLPDGIFAGCANLTALQLPALKKIDNAIFGKTKRSYPSKLKCVKFSAATEDIGCILSGLGQLEDIQFPTALCVLSANALYGDKHIISLDVPRNAVVEDCAFSSLCSLASLSCSIFDSNRDLGLQNLQNLDCVTVLNPDGRPYSLGAGVLTDLRISQLTFENGAPCLENLAPGSLSGLTNVSSLDFSRAEFAELPENVFAQDKLLSSVHLNADCCRSIRLYAFAETPSVSVDGNAKLCNIEYPGTQVRYLDQFSKVVANLGPSAFYQASFNGPIEMIVLSAGESAFEESDITAAFLHFGKTSQSILPTRAFANCKKLQTALFTQIRSIESSCFYGCCNLLQFDIDCAFHAKAHAFDGCISLSSFPFDRLAYADDYAFSDCSCMIQHDAAVDLRRLQVCGQHAFANALTCNIAMLDGHLLLCDSVADDAFSGCKIETVKLDGMCLSELSGCPYYESDSLSALYSKLVRKFGISGDVQFELDDAVIRQDGRGNPFSCLIAEDGILKMVDIGAPDYKQFIADSVIPFNIHTIGENAFSNFSDLTHIDLNNVVNVSSNAFSRCLNLSSVRSSKLRVIGENAFYECAQLQQFDFYRVQSIGKNAFCRCGMLEAMLGDQVAYVGEGAFSGCIGLQQVRSQSALAVEPFAFRDCISLQEVDFGQSGLETLAKCTFIGCKALQSLTLCKSIQSIDEWTLKGTSGKLVVIFKDMHPLDMLAAVGVDNSFGSAVGAKFGISQNGNARMLLQTVQDDLLVRLYDTAKRVALLKARKSADDIFIIDNGVLVGIKDENVTTGVAQIDGTDISAIAPKAFSDTRKLLSLVIAPQTEFAISSHAFIYNTSLREITLSGDNFSYIAADAFGGCSVEKVILPPLLSVGGYGLNCSYSLSSLNFTDGTEEILASAMVDCGPILTNVKFPSTAKKIGAYAFAETASYFPMISAAQLKELTNLTEIGDYAFYNALQAAENDTLTIPASVTKIGAAAFSYNEDAWNCTISAFEAPIQAHVRNVQDIGPSAFMFNGFRDVTFNTQNPALSSIGDYAFAYPKKKCSIRIPRSIRHIGANAFKKNIVLNPDKVAKNTISVDVSSVDEMLNIINSLSSPDFTAQNTIGITNHTCLLATGENAETYQNFLYALDGKLNLCPDSMQIDIQDRALLSVVDQTVTSALIPKYVNVVCASAFKGCGQLTAVSALNLGIQLQASAFCDCSSLVYLNGPDEFYVEQADSYVFSNCSQLENVRLHASALSVGECAFYNCQALTSVQSGDADAATDYQKLVAIGPSAFLSCTSIKDFTIPNTITSIGSNAFDSCVSLQHLQIDLTTDQFKAQLSIDQDIGNAVSNLFGGIRQDAACEIIFTNIVYMNDGNAKLDYRLVGLRELADGLSAISSVDTYGLETSGQDYLNLSSLAQVDNFAFRNVTALHTVNILPSSGSQLQTIGDFAFSSCSNLKHLNDNKLSCKYVGMHAFDGCINLNDMQIDLKKLTMIGKGAFAKSRMKTLTFYVDDDIDIGAEDAILQEIKTKIKFDANYDLNPLALPEDCQIKVIDRSRSQIALYDCQLNSLMHTDIDMNRNQMVFVDKSYGSIKPLLLVKPANEHCLPVIAKNEFHVNIIGRWK